MSGCGGREVVAALCVSGRSIYKHMDGVEAYDRTRDAFSFAGVEPVVAHPPCRTWSRYLRHQAKASDVDKERRLAWFCLEKVVQNGGCLEQPAWSWFWEAAGLPWPGETRPNPFFYSVYIEQWWFGYASRKPTWVLVCGVPPRCLPGFKRERPVVSGRACSAFGRSRTMQSFAEWLVCVARESWWSASRGVARAGALAQARPLAHPGELAQPAELAQAIDLAYGGAS